MLDAPPIMFWAAIGAINAFLAVACGAFGAHALKRRLDAERLAVFETGARYQMYHALALIAVSWLAATRGEAADTAGALFLAGIVFFSGSLYALALSGVRKLGAMTPLGGLCFLLGWTDFAWIAMSAGL
jgi:uncharacterized membrane protein YgdD (TMEM256/DUF423 family)